MPEQDRPNQTQTTPLPQQTPRPNPTPIVYTESATMTKGGHPPAEVRIAEIKSPERTSE
jgi:hypothetical protein